MIPAISDDLPLALPDLLVTRLRALEPERREHLIGELQKAGNGH